MSVVTKKLPMPILSKDFMERLLQAGIVPNGCTRVIIDIPANGVVTMHYAVFPEESQGQVVFDLIHDVMTRPEKKEDAE